MDVTEAERAYEQQPSYEAWKAVIEARNHADRLEFDLHLQKRKAQEEAERQENKRIEDLRERLGEAVDRGSEETFLQALLPHIRSLLKLDAQVQELAAVIADIVARQNEAIDEAKEIAAELRLTPHLEAFSTEYVRYLVGVALSSRGADGDWLVAASRPHWTAPESETWNRAQAQLQTMEI